MSFFESIFGKTGPQPAPAPAPAVGNNPAANPPPAATHQSDGTAPNGQVPADAHKPAAEASPVAKFDKLWETAAPSDKSQNQEPQEITPAQMLEAASKVDFSKSINHEDLQKIGAGGEEAVKALVNILNAQSKTIYGQSVVVSKQLVDQAVSQAEAKFAARVPDLVRNHSVKDSLASDPAFNQPAVKGMVEIVQQQLQQKFPTATASQIAAMAKEYFAGAAQVFNGANPASKSTTQAKPAVDDVDWNEWFNAPMPSGGDDLRS